jgi:hypothetical protein
MLGVGVFFTLSGYLITDLLLMSWRRHGNLGLGTFWLRRASTRCERAVADPPASGPPNADCLVR